MKSADSLLKVDDVAGAIADHVSAVIARELAPIVHRLTLLEAREPLRGEKGDKGDPGDTGKIGPAGSAGIDGKDGRDGEPGKDGLKGEPGQDGKDGAPGRDGRDGMPGPSGKDGVNGKDGADGKDGEPGRDGKDGMSLTDFTAYLEDDGRELVLCLGAGETKKELRLNTGAMIYRGVFTDGRTYERGDVVTWGGSGWHCNAETKDKPGDGSKTWTLAIKKGRDGKDGDRGQEGPQGKQGPPGLDRR